MNTLNTLWTKLDPAVQRWVLDNPGTLVLPRTIVNRVETTTGVTMSTDEHGEHWLSDDEIVFLKARIRATRFVGSHPTDSAFLRGDEFPVEALDR